MADAAIAIRKTLINEGGYSDNPADSGGPTMMGITQKDMPGKNLRELTEDEAIAYYLENYWKTHFSEISNQLLADKLFDMSVLFGVGTTVKVLQIVLGLTADGAFGPTSLEKLNSVEPISCLAAFKSGMVTHCLEVVKSNPQDRVFFQGWVRRINS